MLNPCRIKELNLQSLKIQTDANCKNKKIKMASVFRWSIELQYEQGQHVRKSLVMCTSQLASGLLLKKLKYFDAMLNIFEFSRA